MPRLVAKRKLRNMAQLGDEAGFKFDFFDGMKMVNTRDVHILLDYAKNFDKQTQLKFRLFEALFSERKDVSRRQVPAGELEAVGLDVVRLGCGVFLFYRQKIEILPDHNWSPCGNTSFVGLPMIQACAWLGVSIVADWAGFSDLDLCRSFKRSRYGYAGF